MPDFLFFISDTTLGTMVVKVTWMKKYKGLAKGQQLKQLVPQRDLEELGSEKEKIAKND